MDLVEIRKAMPSALKGKIADPFGKVPEGTGPWATSKLRSKRIGRQAGQLKREGDIPAFRRKLGEGRSQMWNRRELEPGSSNSSKYIASPGTVPLSRRMDPKADLEWMRGRRARRHMEALAASAPAAKPGLRDRAKAKVLKLRNKD